MHRLLLSVFVLTMLSACATAPVNFGKPPTSSSIGLVVLVDEKPRHSHVGTTAFQNFDVLDATETDFRSRFASRSADALREGGFDVRRIEPTPLLIEKRTGLFTYMSSSVYFHEDVKSELDALASDNSLDYVILVYPLVGPAWANSAAFLEGYGLYTRCAFGNCAGFALNYVGARIYDVANRSSLRPGPFRYFQQPELPDSASVEDPKNVAAAVVDEAAELGLESFVRVYEEMLRTSQFIE